MSRLVAAPLPVEVVETDARPVRGLAFRIPRCLAAQRWASPLVAVLLLLSLVGVAVGQSTMLLGASRAVFLGDAGSGNVVAVEVGSVAKATGTGNQDIPISTNGTAFAAGSWAVIFWVSASGSASGTWVSHALNGLGFVANGGGSISQYCVSNVANNGQTTGLTGRRGASACISMTDGAASANVDQATFTSFVDSTHMRINWSTQAAGWGAKTINYMIISGLTGAKVLTWNGPASTGTKAVTGAGFSPDVVFHVTNVDTAIPASTTRAFFGWGVMNAAGEQISASTESDTTNPSNTSRWQHTDDCLLVVNASEGTTLARAAYSSMDSDGFTTNFTTNGLGASYYYASLCIKGVSSKIGSVAKSTGAAPVSQNLATGLAFTPKGALINTIGVSDSTASSFDNWSLGATDGTNERALATQDADNSSPTVCGSVWYSGKSALYPNYLTGTTLAVGNTTLGTTTSINWTTNNGDIPLILFVLLG